MDALPPAEQAEWLAYDMAMRGEEFKPLPDANAKPPQFASAEEKNRWILAQMGAI